MFKRKVPIVLTYTLFLLNLLALNSDCSNILFYLGNSPHSHLAWASPLVAALAKSGHNVTIILPETNPRRVLFDESVTELIVAPKIDEDHLNLKLAWGKLTNIRLAATFTASAEKECRSTLSNPGVIEWLHSPNRSVDMVILDNSFNECAFGIAYKFKASTVLMGSIGVMEWHADELGYPAETNWIPSMGYDYFPEAPPSFLKRVFGTYAVLYLRFIRSWITFPWLNTAFRDNMNFTVVKEQLPTLEEMAANVSLFLVNTHFSEEFGRSLPPMVIPVGGLHLSGMDEAMSLPKDIIKFIQQSKTLVYISFGSVVTPSSSSLLRNAVISAIRDLPHVHFLVKWDGRLDAPKNAFVTEWVPQRTVLGHRKISLFVTHGGLLSTQEAVYCAVPMIAIPVFVDQDSVADRLHRTRRGIRLFIRSLTNSSLTDAITTVLTNKEYKVNMERTSKLFRDRPQQPLDAAVWWIEYVLRHGNDAQVLKPLAVNQYWFQKRLLDVWVFTGIALIFATFVAIRLLRCIYAVVNAAGYVKLHMMHPKNKSKVHSE